jgi:hypothetical protein
VIGPYLLPDRPGVPQDARKVRHRHSAAKASTTALSYTPNDDRIHVASPLGIRQARFGLAPDCTLIDHATDDVKLLPSTRHDRHLVALRDAWLSLCSLNSQFEILLTSPTELTLHYQLRLLHSYSRALRPPSTQCPSRALQPRQIRIHVESVEAKAPAKNLFSIPASAAAVSSLSTKTA